VFAQPVAVQPTADPTAAEQSVAADAVLRPTDAKTASRWLTFAYEVADPADVVSAVDIITADPAFTPESVLPIAILIANLRGLDEKTIDSWVTVSGELAPVTRHVLTTAMWWRDTDADVRLLAVADRIGSERPKEAVALRRAAWNARVPLAEWPHTPQTIDLWWAAFSGSGSTDWVDRIIDATTAAWTDMAMLRGSLPATDEEKASLIIKEAGAWSLASNAYQHPRVLKRLRERRATFTGEWPVVDVAIEEAEKRIEADAAEAAEAQAPQPKPAP
jgi:hypothetical protein